MTLHTGKVLTTQTSWFFASLQVASFGRRLKRRKKATSWTTKEWKQKQNRIWPKVWPDLNQVAWYIQFVIFRCLSCRPIVLFTILILHKTCSHSTSIGAKSRLILIIIIQLLIAYQSTAMRRSVEMRWDGNDGQVSVSLFLLLLLARSLASLIN